MRHRGGVEEMWGMSDREMGATNEKKLLERVGRVSGVARWAVPEGGGGGGGGGRGGGVNNH